MQHFFISLWLKPLSIRFLSLSPRPAQSCCFVNITTRFKIMIIRKIGNIWASFKSFHLGKINGASNWDCYSWKVVFSVKMSCINQSIRRSIFSVLFICQPCLASVSKEKCTTLETEYVLSIKFLNINTGYLKDVNRGAEFRFFSLLLFVEVWHTMATQKVDR